MKLFKSAWLFTGLLAAFCCAAQDKVDESLFRTGQPEVLKPDVDRAAQQAQVETRIVADFRTAYERRKRPKFLMLWHRELSDSVTANKEVSASATSSGESARDNYSRVVTVRWKDGAEMPVSLLPLARDAEFESGFQKTLRSGTANLVDRNTAIRLTALNKTRNGENEKDFDFQTIEAGALAEYAQYFIEVRFVPDADSKGGVEPRVTVIASGTGEILADIVMSDLYKRNAGDSHRVATEQGFVTTTGSNDATWKATDHGFEKQTQKLSGIAEGRLAALALMQELANTWTEAGGG